MLHNVQALQYAPARRIQTIAADFLAWKFFPVEYERSQAGKRAKCGAARSGRATAYDDDIKPIHYASNSVVSVQSALAHDLITAHNSSDGLVDSNRSHCWDSVADPHHVSAADRLGRICLLCSGRFARSRGGSFVCSVVVRMRRVA